MKTTKLKLWMQFVQQGGNVSMKTLLPPENSAPSSSVSKHPSYQHVLERDTAVLYLTQCSDLKVEGEKRILL